MSPEVPRLLLFTRAAKLDIADAMLWCEERRRGAGAAFLEAVDACAERLKEFPESSPCVHRDARRALVSGFPYALFYTSKRNTIRVVAVMHWRQDPARWQARVP